MAALRRRHFARQHEHCYAANFKGQKPMIEVKDAAMPLIDHQSGLFQTVQDIPLKTLSRM